MEIGLKFCLDFLGSVVKPYMYEKIQEAIYKCKEIDKKLEEKYNKIPEENKTQPRTSVLGPSLETLKYNLDEEHIKEMFINLLSNELDNRKQSKISPAFIRIVAELSKKDALFLKKFKDYNTDAFTAIEVKIKTEGMEGSSFFKRAICTSYKKDNGITSMSTYTPDGVVLDNLQRLKLINVYFDKFFPEQENEYLELFSTTTNRIHLADNDTFIYDKGIVELTDFGKCFIDICLS